MSDAIPHPELNSDPGTAATPAPEQPVAPQIPATPTQPGEAIQDLEIRTHPSIQKFKDFDSLGRSYIELEKSIGKKGVLLPGEDASPADVRKAMTSLGCPESPDGYTTEGIFPESVQVDEGFLSAMKHNAWQHGMNESQWKGFASSFGQYQSELIQQQHQQLQDHQQRTERTLREQWGANFEKKTSLARDALRTVFGDAASEVAGMDAPDGSILGNSPAFTAVLAELGERLQEHDLMTGRPSISGPGPDQAQQELATLKASPEFMQAFNNANAPGHHEAVQKWTTLQQAIHGGQRQGAQPARGVAIGNVIA